MEHSFSLILKKSQTSLSPSIEFSPLYNNFYVCVFFSLFSIVDLTCSLTTELKVVQCIFLDFGVKLKAA